MTNASIHRGRRFIFNVDIKDFFDSINFGRVYGFLLRTKILRRRRLLRKSSRRSLVMMGKLPQGSPCSPVISNLIGQILDIRLVQLARDMGAATRAMQMT